MIRDHEFVLYQWSKERCGYVDGNGDMCGYLRDAHDKPLPGEVTMGKHYTVLVQIKEVTDAEPVKASSMIETPRVVHDVLNIATTADTASAAVLRAVRQLELERDFLAG